MSRFEAATLVRSAPWLTMLIFVWSIVSGLFGGHLPHLNNTQPVMLQQPPPVWQQQALRPRQEVVIGPSHVHHEGRLLQAGSESHSAPSNQQADPFLQDLEAAGLSSQQSALFTGGDLRAHERHVANFTQAADSEQYEATGAQASSAAGLADSSAGRANTLEQLQADSAAHDIAEHSLQQDAVPANSGAGSLQTESIGYTDGDDILSLVGLSAGQLAEHHAAHAAAHDRRDSHPARHGSSHRHVSEAPAVVTCPVHRDLPLPGMDIMAAGKDRCYPHPLEYKNINYLNDSFYMLYHHDIPTSEAHPAFTWGNLGRFAHVSHKMQRKDPVTVTFVGGSVSSSYCKNPSVTCWVAPVSDWLTQQNPQVNIINNAIGGTTSRTTAECFDAMVGKDADLVFLEYSYNDRFGVDPAQQQQGYELLVRKLLKLPQKPAVIVVHWWGPKHECLPLVSKEEAEARAPSHSHHQCAMTLWNSTEDQIQKLVDNYGIQSISFRNAYWAEIDAELDGFLPDQTLMPDLIHPSMRGVELLGDLVITFLSGATAHTTNLKHQHLIKSVDLPLAQPLFVDAALDEQSNTCTRGNALQDMKMHTVDWYWVSGKKPGFQTDVPGASLVLMVTLPAKSQVDKLSLGYLASYENMGWAQVECLGACSCPVLQIDANSTARASQEHFATFAVHREESGNGCILKVTTLYRSSAVNAGHRFKVSSVAWSGSADSNDAADGQRDLHPDTAGFQHGSANATQLVSLGSE